MLMTGPVTMVVLCLPNISLMPLLLFLSLLLMLTWPHWLLSPPPLLWLALMPSAMVLFFDFCRPIVASVSSSRFIGSALTAGGDACTDAATQIAIVASAAMKAFMIHS